MKKKLRRKQACLKNERVKDKQGKLLDSAVRENTQKLEMHNKFNATSQQMKTIEIIGRWMYAH